MALVRLPINVGLVKAVDEVGLTSHGASMRDCYVDELGNVNRRPGLVELCDLGTSQGVDGLFWWEEQQWTLAVSNGNLYKITASDGTKSQITLDGTNFETDTLVTWADFGTDVYAANGGKVKKIPSAGNGDDLADVDAPTAVSHVATLDRYLLALEDGTGNFHWSDVNAPTTWTGNYSEAEALRDDLTALKVNNLEIHLLGKQSLEMWHNDGSSPFVRLYQGFIQRGTVAPYSFAWCTIEDTYAWLDENRQVVLLKGRTPVPLSLTMTKHIQNMTTVSDAVGHYIEVIGRPFYVLQFPTEGETLVYDFTAKQWYQWGYWNTGTASYDNFRGRAFCLAPAWNFSLVGDRANGKVYKFDNTNYDDDGNILRTLDRTGHINHGTEAKKKYCNGLYLRVKRTDVVADDATPDLLVNYRDNGETSWNTERTVSLQQVGNTEFRAKLTRLGSYYSRQWQFVLSDAYPLCLVSVEEDVDIEP